MQKKLFWEAVSNEERNHVINQIKDIISTNNAYIINFTMFSDLALGLSIGVEENNIYELHRSLCEILTVSDLIFENRHKNGEEEWLISMNVSFGKGEGALKVVVPEVPG